MGISGFKITFCPSVTGVASINNQEKGSKYPPQMEILWSKVPVVVVRGASMLLPQTPVCAPQGYGTENLSLQALQIRLDTLGSSNLTSFYFQWILFEGQVYMPSVLQYQVGESFPSQSVHSQNTIW